jgi:cellulose synthase/poly-beta-1,6-N-acetylglucosamine synthase-like glycosyltransferase
MTPHGAHTLEAVALAARILTTSLLIGYVFRLLLLVRCALHRELPPPISVRYAEHQELVSVLIPAYNEERVIRASINELLSSNYKSLQVIVVDDGSRDSTASIVARAFDNDSRVTLVRRPHNGGKSSALNTGLEVADGEYIVVMDADTMPDADFIGRMLQPLQQDRADAVAGNVKVSPGAGLITSCQCIEYVSVLNSTRLFQGRTGNITTIAGAAGAMRKSTLRAVGGYSSKTKAEDADLTLRLAHNGFRLLYVREAIVHTEAPSSWRGLFYQRVRWIYGNLQCIGFHVRRKGALVGTRMLGFPMFVYENTCKAPVEFLRASVPLGVALGWLPIDVLYGYLALFLLFFISVKVSFAVENELLPRFSALAAYYSLWPIFFILPYGAAAWKFLTGAHVTWRQEARRGVLAGETKAKRVTAQRDSACSCKRD